MKNKRIVFTSDAYNCWKVQNKKTLKRINILIEDIYRNGNEGIGKPELLRENYSGCYSRRIDEKNRLIYRIENDVVIIFACRTHYQDK